MGSTCLVLTKFRFSDKRIVNSQCNAILFHKAQSFWIDARTYHSVSLLVQALGFQNFHLPTEDFADSLTKVAESRPGIKETPKDLYITKRKAFGDVQSFRKKMKETFIVRNLCVIYSHLMNMREKIRLRDFVYSEDKFKQDHRICKNWWTKLSGETERVF